MYVTREVWGMSCLQKEPFRVWLEWIRPPVRQICWALWAVPSAADGQKGSFPGGVNQQLYWTLIFPWNNGCVCSGCCLALVFSCQEQRRADRVRARDWREIHLEVHFLRVAVQGPLEAGCLKLSTRQWTFLRDVGISGFLFSAFPERGPSTSKWKYRGEDSKGTVCGIDGGRSHYSTRLVAFVTDLPIFKYRLSWNHIAAELLS